MKFQARASSLGKIMAKSSGLTEKEAKTLDDLRKKNSKSKRRAELEEKLDFKPEFDISTGAKTYVEQQYKQHLFGMPSKVIDSNALSKGTECEDDSIELYNEVFFTVHEKMDESNRKDVQGLTGCCDILDELGDTVIDIKSSYTFQSFPMLRANIDSSLYEWQLRAYMMLYDKSKARLAYCLVNTPDHLIPDSDPIELHIVDDIDPRLRVTCVDFERDIELEQLIIYKIKECQRYYEYYGTLLDSKNL